jgi:hypothetical protein
MGKFFLVSFSLMGKKARGEMAAKAVEDWSAMLQFL